MVFTLIIFNTSWIKASTDIRSMLSQCWASISGDGLIFRESSRRVLLFRVGLFVRRTQTIITTLHHDFLDSNLTSYPQKFSRETRCFSVNIFIFSVSDITKPPQPTFLFASTQPVFILGWTGELTPPPPPPRAFSLVWCQAEWAASPH